MDSGPGIRVECFAGYRGDERPLAFWIGVRRIAIHMIVDSWLAEDGAYFRVAGPDGMRYVLRRDDRHDNWELTDSRLGAEQDEASQ